MLSEPLAVDSLSVSAPAKINLYLKVIGRREDGYHFLATLVQKIGLTDTLLLRKKKTGISLACPGSDLPADSGNIVYRAAQLFFATAAGRLDDDMAGAAIVLSKSIPVAAGLGGGSSDAAAVLRGLNQLYGTPCSREELLTMAVQLGADVPLFIVDWPVVWATGIGDKLQRAHPLLDYRILLVNPGIPVSTRQVYEKFALTVGKNGNNLRNSQKESVTQEKSYSVFSGRSIRPEELENDLEEVTILQYPIVASLKERLLAGGAVAALMSGSGPSVFGLFPDHCLPQATTCCEELKKKYGNAYLVDPWH